MRQRSILFLMAMVIGLPLYYLGSIAEDAKPTVGKGREYTLCMAEHGDEVRCTERS